MNKAEVKEHIKFLTAQGFKPNQGTPSGYWPGTGGKKRPKKRFSYINRNGVCIYKRKGYWKVWVVPQEDTKTGPFDDTTACVVYAQCQGWIT